MRVVRPDPHRFEHGKLVTIVGSEIDQTNQSQLTQSCGVARVDWRNGKRFVDKFLACIRVATK
jgi:hypothetical protein